MMKSKLVTVGIWVVGILAVLIVLLNLSSRSTVNDSESSDLLKESHRQMVGQG